MSSNQVAPAAQSSQEGQARRSRRADEDSDKEENIYILLNADEEQVYFAKELSETCGRQGCGPIRDFVIRVTDNLGMKVFTVEREPRLCCFTSWCAKWNCCADKLKILAGGHTIGYVRQRQSYCDPCYVVTDEDENELLYMEGPCYL